MIGKMRILITQESDWLKRNNHQQHHLAELMSLRGHEVRVIDYEILWRQGKKEFKSKREVFADVSKIYDRAKITIIRPSIIKVSVLDYLSLLWTHSKEINKQIKEFKPDVVIGFGILNSMLASIACKNNDIPFIYYWIDVLHELLPNRLFKSLGMLCECITFTNTQKVLVINQSLKSFIKQYFRMESEVLSAGINLRQFNPDIDGSKLRIQYGFKDNDIVLFYMGWLYKFSGLREVMKQMIEHKNAKLLIVGDGDDYAELLKLKYEYHLDDNVILTGKKPYIEIPELIASSDICILPAYPVESIMQNIVPIKIYEYMAMGKPIIATRLNGLQSEFGYNIGIIYASKPEDVVMKAIDLKAVDDFKDYGKSARQYVEKLSWVKIADDFENILNKVAGG